MGKRLFLPILTLASIITTIIINGLANALPINGQLTADIANKYPTLFFPAPYVFAIWGIIYIGLIIYGIYQILPQNRENKKIIKANIWVILSSVANSCWILLWHYEKITLSVLVMLTLLASLIMIYHKLNIGSKVKLLTHVPFSIYLGWISVATIANISTFLTKTNWNGFGISDITWTIIMIIVATILTALIIIRKKDYVFAGVIIWAFVGIIARYPNESSLTIPLIISVITILGVGAFKFSKKLFRP